LADDASINLLPRSEEAFIIERETVS
jgi:hypothetical protein